MFGHFKFSRMNGILWECGTAERSEASTALNARTRVRAKKIWQRALPKPERSFRCALHMGIHPNSRRSSYFFVPLLFIVIEPGCYSHFCSSFGETITNKHLFFTFMHIEYI